MADVMLDQFIVFSDHHSHAFPFGSREEQHNGVFVNSRLKASYDVLNQIDSYAKESGVKNIVFCGDLFHIRENVSTAAMNLMYDAISSLAKSKKVWLMPGNHDYSDRDGRVHSLHTFRSIPNVTVMDWENPNRTISLAGKMGEPTMFSFVPYSDDRIKITAAIAEAADRTLEYVPHVLFGHFGIQGAKVGSDYVLVNDADLSVVDIPWPKFTGCFFGHYHEHQQLFKNGWYVGATHHHNWGDANSTRGFLHVRVFRDYVEFDRIETDAPRFLVLRGADTAEVRPKDFVRILTSKKLDPQEAEVIRSQNGSLNCEIVYVPEEAGMTDIALSEENLSPTAMVSAWVKANSSWVKKNLPKVEDDDLVKYGHALLVSKTNG